MGGDVNSEMLDPDYEKNLWELCTNGDFDAREELIVAYRPLVFWIAGKIHVGASSGYDPRRNARADTGR